MAATPPPPQSPAPPPFPSRAHVKALAHLNPRAASPSLPNRLSTGPIEL
jgi:hypothetical protein